jgi:type IV pilus assembly protein PilW
MEALFMVTKNVNHKQLGASLIELLVASSIGLIALMLIGNVFVEGQKISANRSQKLLLIQDLNDALRFIKEESQRAGYSRSGSYSEILSGANDIIHISGAQLSFIYQSESGSPSEWRFARFKYESETLKICSRKNISFIPDIYFSPQCLSLIDNNLIKVTDFTLNYTALGSSVSSAYLSISTNAELKNTAHRYSSEIKIKQRNWK